MKPRPRTLLRESRACRRTEGFSAAVEDLGTHAIHGVQVPYSKQAVYNVLYGRLVSQPLLKRIIERRPDLLGLSFVSAVTRAEAQSLGWRPGMMMPWRDATGRRAQ